MGDYAGLTVEGADRFDQLGGAVSDAGDVNGDGIGDFIVGASRANQSEQPYQGAAYVIFGTTDGPATLNVDQLDGSNGFRIFAFDERPSDANYEYADFNELGTFVGGLGDINGDGVDDVVVAGQTAYDFNFYEGGPFRTNFVYVIYGKDTAEEGGFDAGLNVADLDGSNGFTVTNVGGDVNGVSSAGDVNGDGLGDLLISQSPVPTYGYGGYYGYYAAAAATSGDAPEVVAAAVGDGPLDREGAYGGFVIFGDSAGFGPEFDVTGLNGANGFAVGVERSDFSTRRYSEGGRIYAETTELVAVGDVNGDGFADLFQREVVRTREVSYGYDEYNNYYYDVDFTTESQAWIIFGKNTDPLTTPAGAPFDAVVDPDNSPDALPLFWSSVSFFREENYYGFYGYGAHVFGVGDINGDGFDDVAVGDRNITFIGYDQSNGDSAFGAVSIYFGGPEGVDFTPDDDAGGDGLSDGLNVNGSQVPGSPNAADLIIVNSSDYYYNFGAIVAGVGDINGDGIDDFAISEPVGALFGDDGYYDVIGGSVYLVFGQDALGGEPIPTVVDIDNLTPADIERLGYRFFNSNPNEFFFDSFGQSISKAGDVNGDGVDDFIIGYPYANVQGTSNYGEGFNTGEAYVIFGGLDSLEAADAADGVIDHQIDVQNLGVDVETGVLPIELSVVNAGFFHEFQAEGDAGPTIFSFNVRRTGDLSESVSFDFAVSGFGANAANTADFVGGAFPTGTASFAAGSSVAVVEIEIQGDTAIELNEDFAFTISNPTTDGPSPVSITADTTFGRIFNDDFPITFNVFDAVVFEGDDAADERVLEFRVRRSGPVGVEATIDFEVVGRGGSPVNAADFEAGQFPASGTLVFAAGETDKFVRLQVAEDVIVEPTELAELRLSNAQSSLPTNIADGIGIGTLATDDFPPQILVTGGVTKDEGDAGFTPFTFQIERRGETDGVVEVTYDINPFPAPGDFFAADSNDVEGFLPSFGNVVRFEDGETAKTVTVNVIGDGVIEPRESFEVRITQVNALNGVDYDVIAPFSVATIRNDDGRPPVIPPGVEADVFGDPHIITLDGLGYDFQAVGEYILVETLPGAVNPFQVQVRFEPLEGSDLVSITTRLAVEIGGHVVEIDAAGADPLLVDGVAPSADELALGAIDVDGDGTADVFFNEAVSEFTVVLNGEAEQLFVKIMDGAINSCVFLADTPDGNAGNVRGLMGDGAGDGTADDLALRNGTVLTQPVDFADLYGQYADSWRLDGSEADLTPLFSNTVSFPSGFPAAVLTVDDLPADLRALAEAAAIAAGLDPNEPEIFNAAVLDFALTGDENFFAGALGLAADPTDSAEPANAPALPATFGVTSGQATVDEGDAGEQNLLFTFYRIGDTAGAATVSYAIGGGVDANDLNAALTGDVAFADGETTKSLFIAVTGDLATEADETLRVSITGVDVGDALIGAPSAKTIILTDDFAPVAVDDVFATNEDTRVTGDLFDPNPDTADSDADGDALTVTGVTTSAGQDRAANGGLIILPSGAHLRVNADGSFTYDPFGFNIGGGSAADSLFDRLDDGEIATETFTYEIADGNGGFDTATATINVSGVNDAPVGVIDALNLTEDDASATINVLDGSIAPDVDPEGGPLTITSIRLGGDTFAVDPNDGATVAIATGGRLEIQANGVAEFFTEGAFENLGEALPQLVSRNINFTYTVADEKGLTDDVLLQVFVAGVNDAPVAADDEFTVDEDAAGVFLEVLANDDDVEGDDFDIDDFTQPTNGEIVEVAGGFEYSPDADFNGIDLFTYRISDGALASAFATVTISVNAINDPPEAVDDAFATDEDTPLSGDVSLNDSDVDGDALTFALDQDAANGDLSLNDDGTFDYAPDANFFGTDTFVYVASDGVLSASATVTITVDAVADAPVAVDDEFIVDEDSGATFLDVLANDFDDDGEPISAEIVAQPANGQVISVSGGLEYTPDADFNGVDTFTYSVTDSAFSSGVATVTIVVNPVNDAPEALDDAFTTNEDTPLAGDVSQNDSDVDGEELTFALDQDAANGDLSLNADGTFVYRPDANFFGTDTFVYLASDGAESVSATVTITVDPVDDGPPVAGDDNFVVAGNSDPVVLDVLANDVNVDDDGLNILESSPPTNGQLSLVNGALVYTPNPGFVGADSFAYLVSDDGGETSNTATVSLTVVDPVDQLIAISDLEIEEGDDGETKSAFFVVTRSGDVSAPTGFFGVELANGSATAGEDFDNGLFLPFNFGAGETSRRVEVTILGDDAPESDESFFLNLIDTGSGETVASGQATILDDDGGNDAPVAVNDAFSTDEDTPLAGDVSLNDFDDDGDLLSFALGLDVGNGALTLNADGTFDYAPDEDFFGTDAFTYVVSDGEATGTATVTIAVNPVNDAPDAVDDAFSTDEDTPLSGDVGENDSDVEGDTLTFTVDQDVANGALTLNADGTFDYTPDQDFFGTDTFVYVASDGDLMDTATVTIAVAPVNDPPTAVDDTFTTDEDVLLSGDVLANDADVDGDTLTVSLGANVANGDLSLNADGTFDYLPNLDFFGTDTFSYVVTDGSLTSEATVTIAVSPVNDAPVAVDDSFAIDENAGAIFLDVLANDFDVDGDGLSVVLADGAANGLLQAAAGGVTYTPNAGFSGEDVFVYQITDGELESASATVTVTVNAINDPPEAVDDSFTTDEDTPLSGDVSLNDSDPENDTLTFALVQSAANGALLLNADGTFDYTPDQDFFGSDLFVYEVSDGDRTAQATATITVAPVNDAPEAADDSFATVVDMTLVGDVGENDVDVDGDTLTFALGLDVANGALSLNADGTFEYIPDAGFIGTETFTYVATDGLEQATATVSITVVAEDDDDDLDIKGDDGPNRLRGAGGDDHLAGLGGDDVLQGFGGNDVLNGGSGADLLFGGDGDDAIVSGDGDDTAFGGDGDDEINGDDGEDLIFGGEGDDVLRGNDDNDRLIGEAGDDELIGGSGDDRLEGGEGDDLLRGLGGDDILNAGSGDDRALGGDGDDVIRGGDGDDNLQGQDGDDVINGDDGDDAIIGGAGADILRGGEGDDAINGGEKNDIVVGGAGSDMLRGNDGDDLIRGEAGDDALFGGEGRDRVTGGEGDDKIRGDSGEDTLLGEAGDDIIDGGESADLLDGGDGDDMLMGDEGDDVAFGRAGDDELHGDSGDDMLFGGEGDDTLDGGDSDDRLFGEAGDDDLSGGDGDDRLVGDIGDDVLDGGDGDDLLNAGDGDDELIGGAGDDALRGDAGEDVAFGGTGDDVINGGEGDDELDGGDDDDVLRGEDGADKLFGGAGQDLLIGGLGQDVMSGGEGPDRFFLTDLADMDIVLDFEVGVDLLVFGLVGSGAGSVADTVFDGAASSIVTTNGGVSVLLAGVVGVAFDDVT